LSCVEEEIKRNKIQNISSIFFDDTLLEPAVAFINTLKKTFSSLKAEVISLGPKPDKHGKFHLISWIKDWPKEWHIDLFSI